MSARVLGVTEVGYTEVLKWNFSSDHRRSQGAALGARAPLGRRENFSGLYLQGKVVSAHQAESAPPGRARVHFSKIGRSGRLIR